MEVPEVVRNYTAHLFSMQAKCSLGEVAETRVRTTMPQQLLCGVRAAGWQKVRLKFLYSSVMVVMSLQWGHQTFCKTRSWKCEGIASQSICAAEVNGGCTGWRPLG